jgi:uncharacterized protein
MRFPIGLSALRSWLRPAAAVGDASLQQAWDQASAWWQYRMAGVAGFGSPPGLLAGAARSDRADGERPMVSIVVPVLHDADTLAELLESLPVSRCLETIVVSGDAEDGSSARWRGRFPDVRWLVAVPGRGGQMNDGAASARGRWLLFLHADTRLGSGWLGEIERAERAGDVVAGHFRLKLDSPVCMARVIERTVRWRVRWMGLPYGDQAIFVRRDVFEALGGYRVWPLMEDVDLVRRLKRVGPLLHSKVPVLSSARRWERRGWVRGSLENMLLVALFYAGVSPERLAGWYYRGWRSGAGGRGCLASGRARSTAR